MANMVQKGPGGIYWMVQDENGNVVSTHSTKEEAEKAAKPAPKPKKMATVP